MATSVAFKCNMKRTVNKQSVYFWKRDDHDGYQEDEVAVGRSFLLFALLTTWELRCKYFQFSWKFNNR
jgi:hypothetical protein